MCSCASVCVCVCLSFCSELVARFVKHSVFHATFWRSTWRPSNQVWKQMNTNRATEPLENAAILFRFNHRLPLKAFRRIWHWSWSHFLYTCRRSWQCCIYLGGGISAPKPPNCTSVETPSNSYETIILTAASTVSHRPDLIDSVCVNFIFSVTCGFSNYPLAVSECTEPMIICS